MRKSGQDLILSASDLVGHLNCRHLTALDLSVANGTAPKPKIWKDLLLEALWERGTIHEKNYVDYLTAKGLKIVVIDGFDITGDAVKQTLGAMQAGAEIIVQGAFLHNGWCGRTDILRRVETPSSLGSWSYEVIDTKLARETKAGTVLQLSLYSELLFLSQGISPEFMHVVVPWSDFVPTSYRVTEYAAYYRRVKASLEKMVNASSGPQTYPDPKEHCDVCRWNTDCDNRRRIDDHLCLVAGISKIQINELKQHTITSTSSLAETVVPLPWKPERGSVHSYVRIREQARIQIEARKTKTCKFEILPVEEGFGFNCLPEPSVGDIFLDLEGDPFVGESGLEYLFGYQFKDSKGNLMQVSDWALTRREEKKVFETFVDFVIKRLQRFPDLHIYHFAPYEPAALKRLMGRYATCEEQIDQMLRANLFVDLYGVVRHAIRASVESYSIKKLEIFYGYQRQIKLTDANIALANVQASLELNDTKGISDKNKVVVEGYNQDDCVSTRCLRDWLEGLRTKLVSDGVQIARPLVNDGAPSENITDWLKTINELIKQLTNGIPALIEDRSPEQQAKWILANILDWHRREDKAKWWEFFRLSDLSAEDLLDERAGLSGLSFVGEAGGTVKAPIHRYKFLPQESDLRGGEELKNLGGKALGKVESISFNDRTIDIKKRGDSKDIHPEAIFSHDVINTKELANSLVRLGDYVVKNGITGEGSYKAARDLLLKLEPKLGGDKIRNDGEKTIDAASRIALKFEDGVLPIQGPPGAGKTHTGAQMICVLVKQGKKVGITANSHKVIRNLLDAVIKAADQMDIKLHCVQKPKEPEADGHRLSFVTKNDELFSSLHNGCDVAGGTAWLWASPAAFQTVDVLFVDEAAQMSLANVLAVSQAGKMVVLLGDPQQLDQPMQGSHPEGTDVSALHHILDGQQTITSDQGLFLEETWRLHPAICAFTSELFYEGKLMARKSLEKQSIKSAGLINGAGLRYIAVQHNGNQNASPEEANVICDLVNNILKNKTTWINWEGVEKIVGLDDILIITPYNAQVFEIQSRLPGARIGTVDKFQGQEAPIAIYSMASSSHADAPRGMEFLYSLNRLNVATSRAKCISILVGSPQIFEAECRSPHQIKLANAFCRFLEMALPIDKEMLKK